MATPLILEKYSLGVGDRFSRQAQAQLRACMLAADAGVIVIPVWNKSNREHLIIGSEPATTRAAADRAVKALGWQKAFRVDADHIRLETVGRFLPHSDFFTIDVADSIGRRADETSISAFVQGHPELVGNLEILGLPEPIHNTAVALEQMAGKYLLAVQEAGKIYRHIAQHKNQGSFITEVSMDETESPQTPLELLVILAGLADEGIPLQTIAPKFTGRFNKGVDYVGEVTQFGKEFQEDLSVLAFACKQYSLPASLKLSVHSGSDKFSIYGHIHRAVKRLDAGLHLKTAGTTWLEELIGLAEGGGAGLKVARKVYCGSLEHLEELCAPYLSVIDIDRSRLPSSQRVNTWSGEQFVSALRHEPANPDYNPHFRQLLHVGYKLAAKLGDEYLDALGEFEHSVSRNVTANLFDRHIKPLFLASVAPTKAAVKKEALVEA
jgi:tagaturonate epimerase